MPSQFKYCLQITNFLPYRSHKMNNLISISEDEGLLVVMHHFFFHLAKKKKEEKEISKNKVLVFTFGESNSVCCSVSCSQS